MPLMTKQIYSGKGGAVDGHDSHLLSHALAVHFNAVEYLSGFQQGIEANHV